MRAVPAKPTRPLIQTRAGFELGLVVVTSDWINVLTSRDCEEDKRVERKDWFKGEVSRAVPLIYSL